MALLCKCRYLPGTFCVCQYSILGNYNTNVCSDFPVRYEGPHVISQKQVWVGVVSKGCDGVALNSSYINRLARELELL